MGIWQEPMALLFTLVQKDKLKKRPDYCEDEWAALTRILWKGHVELHLHMWPPKMSKVFSVGVVFGKEKITDAERIFYPLLR